MVESNYWDLVGKQTFDDSTGTKTYNQDRSWAWDAASDSTTPGHPQAAAPEEADTQGSGLGVSCLT